MRITGGLKGSGSPRERDIEVLIALARYRYLTTSQIEKLFYPSRRVTNRRLRVLAKHGLVHRWRRSHVPGGVSNEYVYFLSSAGAKEVATRLKCDTVSYPKPRDRTPAGMDHHLGIAQVWLSLDRACTNTGVEMPQFWPEWEAQAGLKHFVSVLSDDTLDLNDTSRRVSLRPDAAFVLARDDKRSLFFVEVDRQSESIRGIRRDTFSEKFVAYASYRQYGRFKRYGEDFLGFRVLTTWTSQSRMHRARAAAAEMGIGQMFLFTLFEQITPESIFGEIWYRPESPQRVSLITAPDASKRIVTNEPIQQNLATGGHPKEAHSPVVTSTELYFPVEQGLVQGQE